jgi:hypothetical protein
LPTELIEAEPETQKREDDVRCGILGEQDSIRANLFAAGSLVAEPGPAFVVLVCFSTDMAGLAKFAYFEAPHLRAVSKKSDMSVCCKNRAGMAKFFCAGGTSPDLRSYL